MSGALDNLKANADYRHYFDCALKGQLVLKKCMACGHVQFPPRHLCPVCWSDQLEWIEHSGHGRVFSVTTVHRAPVPGMVTPYMLAMVELDGGPRVMANIVGSDSGQAQIGDKVSVAFERRGDAALPQFRMVEGASRGSSHA